MFCLFLNSHFMSYYTGWNAKWNLSSFVWELQPMASGRLSLRPRGLGARSWLCERCCCHCCCCRTPSVSTLAQMDLLCSLSLGDSLLYQVKLQRWEMAVWSVVVWGREPLPFLVVCGWVAVPWAPRRIVCRDSKQAAVDFTGEVVP